MILKYNPENKEFAKINRNQCNMTEAEWKIRNIALNWIKRGYKFLRQKPIWKYILDFYCHRLKLWIEIDDKSHDFKWEYDQERTMYLQEYWIKIIRYTNQEVYYQLEWIIIDIDEKIKERSTEIDI